MGYRSDVSGKFIKTDTRVYEFKELLKTNKIDYFDFKEDDKYFYFFSSYLKWYDGYKEVDAVNGFINELEGDAGLIAIGEDSAVSEVGEPYSVNMYVQTMVTGGYEDAD